YYLSTNRNKQSITIDFTRPEGQQLVRDLAAQSDIVLENFKVGSLARYGLDYATLKQVNPRLIYCSITGFGQTGPYAKRAGYDFLIQAMGGLMSLTGHPDGADGAGPMKVGVALTDIMTGLYAAISVLAALAHRERTGEGQYIDLALLDVQIACLANQNLNYLTTGESPRRLGNAHPNIVPYQAFPTADGDMIIAVGNDSQFANLCRVIEQPDWAADERFATNAARVANRDTLVPALRQITIKRSTDAWVQAMEMAGVPCGPINHIAEVFANEQVQARGMQQTMPHPQAGAVPQVASPINLSATPVRYTQPPPLLSEHTQTILRDVLGLDADRIEQLAQEGVTGQP